MRLRFPAVVVAVVLVVGSMTSSLAESRSAGDVLGGAYPVHGIDVSHYQGPITWSSVASDGVGFAILKATESRKYTDPTFAFNDSQAALAGVPVGAYHVWTPSGSIDDAKAEANHFVHVVQPGVGDVLPVLDMEMNRVPNGMPASVLQAWARTWLTRVTQKTGVRPMVYGSQYLFQTMLGNTTWFADHGYPLWFAWPRTPLPNSMPAHDWQGHGWTFWQHSWTGRVTGIHGAVDQDRYVGANLQTALIAQITAQPGTGGSITDTSGKIACLATQICSALYSPTDLITLTATPETGFSFVSWGGACAGAGTSPTCSLTTLGAKTVTATFSYTLKVKIAGDVPGRVVSAAAGIDCPGDCSGTIAPGLTVPLAASMDQWAGVTWSGDCTGTDPTGCTVTMDQQRTVTATFSDLGPATAHLNAPDRRTDPLRVSFGEPVHRLTTSNVVLRPKQGRVVAASLRCFTASGARTSCATGQVRRATLVPDTPLLRGKSYAAIVDPAGVPPIVDRVHNAVALTRATFSV
jgi:GH25 family lysozyme M1 (1,4-beta-N-acetylmuramidase)